MPLPVLTWHLSLSLAPLRGFAPLVPMLETNQSMLCLSPDHRIGAEAIELDTCGGDRLHARELHCC